MNTDLLDHFAQQLDVLKQNGNLRQFSANVQQGRFIHIYERQMLNLASNDYLGLASDLQLREQFFDETPVKQRAMSSSSSRLLTGNFPEFEQLEASLSQAFAGRAALLFNSGYHMNIGILPALVDAKTLILADKLVHASMIDGMRFIDIQHDFSKLLFNPNQFSQICFVTIHAKNGFRDHNNAIECFICMVLL